MLLSFVAAVGNNAVLGLYNTVALLVVYTVLILLYHYDHLKGYCYIIICIVDIKLDIIIIVINTKLKLTSVCSIHIMFS